MLTKTLRWWNGSENLGSWGKGRAWTKAEGSGWEGTLKVQAKKMRFNERIAIGAVR